MMDKKTSILIVGAGIAGLSAALAAAKSGCHVQLFASLPSERAQSVMAEGGINAALNTKGENDSPAQHAADTLHAGCGLSDPNAVCGMTNAAPELVQWLYQIGVQFNTCGIDELDLRNFGGQKKKRTAFAQSDTGKQIMTALIDAVRKQEAEGLITRFTHHTFHTLLIKHGVCCGCSMRDSYTGQICQYPADAVIIASGGMHGLFGSTTGSLANTGEVTAALFRLGIPMANLEMVQYHPTTVESGAKRLLISEAARGEGGRLYTLKNGRKWYFMEEKYPELGNLMPRDITAREIWKVSKDGPVFLDMTEIPDQIISKKLSGLLDDCMTFLGKDIRKEAIPVFPGIHYFMGGIMVDEKHRTALRHLYAAGECCAQYHGANRLGGNSLLGALYGGQVAAKTAIAEASLSAAEAGILNSQWIDGQSAKFPVLPICSVAPDNVHSAIDETEKPQYNRILTNAMGVLRSEAVLERALSDMESLHSNMALLGRAMLKSALFRKESRGAHWREDYPQQNNIAYQKTTVAAYDGTDIQISFVPVPQRR